MWAVSCRFPNNKTVAAGGSEELSAAQHGVKASADVVFVVEESACNSWAQRSLSTLATELEQALKTRGELLSVCLFPLSVCPSLFVSVFPAACPFFTVCLSVCLCLPVCQSLSGPLCLSDSLTPSPLSVTPPPPPPIFVSLFLSLSVSLSPSLSLSQSLYLCERHTDTFQLSPLPIHGVISVTLIGEF